MSPVLICCARPPRRARASATWRSASRSMPSCRCARTCASSPASMASTAPRRPAPSTLPCSASTCALYANTVARDLPLGLKQRLALAAALLHAPEILFLDEPTSGVDPLTRREFWNRIGTLADAGVTIMVTSHFMDEAEYCDRLGIVSQGRLAAVGTPGELRSSVRSPTLPQPTLEDAFIALVDQMPHGARPHDPRRHAPARPAAQGNEARGARSVRHADRVPDAARPAAGARLRHFLRRQPYARRAWWSMRRNNRCAA